MPEWSPTDCAYLAGFIDGEGTICVFPYHNRRHSALRLCAYNTNREVLEWVGLKFGGRVRLVKRRSGKHRLGYVWEIGGKYAVPIIEACLPYFKIKKQQAELFVEVAATLNQKGNKTAIKSDVINFRVEAARRMTALNRGQCDAG